MNRSQTSAALRVATDGTRCHPFAIAVKAPDKII